MRLTTSSARLCLCRHGNLDALSPPTSRDVAIIFHAHCLSPSSASHDLLHLETLRSTGLVFPLKRLHALIAAQIWSDPESEKLWNKTFSSPYQIWGHDPTTDAMRSRGYDEPNLSTCVRDGAKGRKTRLLETRTSLDPAKIRREPLRRRVLMPNLPGFFDLHFVIPNEALTPATCAPELRRPLSIDLVAASLRQKAFVDKITGLRWARNSTSELRHAISRYRNFMLLMENTSGLVPTCDIDLCWHTHQLSLSSYEKWCIRRFGRLIDHYDNIEKPILEKGLHETSLAWFELYHEEYSTDHLGSLVSDCYGGSSGCRTD